MGDTQFRDFIYHIDVNTIRLMAAIIMAGKHISVEGAIELAQEIERRVE